MFVEWVKEAKNNCILCDFVCLVLQSHELTSRRRTSSNSIQVICTIKRSIHFRYQGKEEEGEKKKRREVSLSRWVLVNKSLPLQQCDICYISMRNVEFIDLFCIEIYALQREEKKKKKRVIYESFQFQCNDKWMLQQQQQTAKREKKKIWMLDTNMQRFVGVYFVQMIITFAIILDDKLLALRWHTSYGEILLFLPLLMIKLHTGTGNYETKKKKKLTE